MADFARLAEDRRELRQKQWQSWLVKNQKLNDTILSRRQGQFVDVDMIWSAARSELDQRHDD